VTGRPGSASDAVTSALKTTEKALLNASQEPDADALDWFAWSTILRVPHPLPPPWMRSFAAIQDARDVTLPAGPSPHKGHVFAKSPSTTCRAAKARRTTSWMLCSVRSDACRATVL
jgi:hypothetical protein